MKVSCITASFDWAAFKESQLFLSVKLFNKLRHDVFLKNWAEMKKALILLLQYECFLNWIEEENIIKANMNVILFKHKWLIWGIDT